ncbi:FHA domain-containing protein [Brevibacillus fluminis]|uniref:FHA domain-containing protein n=1 Tax=Brevibacillus fluminis TaxID=511487 RepID=UPI003F8AFA6D
MLGDGVYVLIKKGDPSQLHARKYLTKSELTIGRQGNGVQPDIAFSSPYISRMHAAFRKVGDRYEIADLSSKHGTEVNGNAVCEEAVVLRHGDRISLAKGVAELVFIIEQDELDATRELPLSVTVKESLLTGLDIHIERREVRLDGKRIPLSGKDMDLLVLLYQRANQAVSYEEVMVHIWPERLSFSETTIPDVGRSEINALVYRLRRKLGPYGEQIMTIPRYGYRLEM